MKTAVIILALVSIILTGAYYSKGQRASREAQAAAESLESCTNQMSELTTKLVLAQSDAALAQSNLQSRLERQQRDAIRWSNQWSQLSSQLTTLQQEHNAVRSRVERQTEQIAQLASQRDLLNHQLQSVTPLQAQLSEANSKLADALQTNSLLHGELGELRLEVANLDRNLYDIEFLNRQMAKAKKWADLKQQATTEPIPARSNSVSSLGLLKKQAAKAQETTPTIRTLPPLELLADETVRLMPVERPKE